MLDEELSTIGQRVRTLRTRRGWSQKKLASLVPGLSQQSVDQLEQGKIARPRFLPEIAEALGVPEPWLRTGKAEGILPRSELPPDDFDIMHDLVLAVEDMLDANGWRLDLASKKLLVRGAYELYLLRHRRAPEEPQDLTKLAETILADYASGSRARTLSDQKYSAGKGPSGGGRFAPIATFNKSDER